MGELLSKYPTKQKKKGKEEKEREYGFLQGEKEKGGHKQRGSWKKEGEFFSDHLTQKYRGMRKGEAVVKGRGGNFGEVTFQPHPWEEGKFGTTVG